MKTEKELRRERRIGIIISVALLSLAVMVWQTLKFVTGYSRVGSSSMAPTLHRGDRVAVNRADNSNDSRFLGFIPEGDIRGRMGHVLHVGECGPP
jgi:signal peptidase I